MEEKLPFEKVEREILVKKEIATNPDFGCIPEERKIKELVEYGIINVNKPQGPTSHQIADYVKKILNLNKVGHSGTLDPNVTGVLPTALAKATRIVQVLLPAGKEYIALMRLHEDVSDTKIKEEFKKLIGTITQLPPIRSAVKRRERQRKIYYANILEIKERNILFKVGCQAGTYIRKLIHDLGLKLNTRAHMVQLVRTKAGPFTDKNWHSLQDLKDAYEFYKQGDGKQIKEIILPIEKAVEHIPKIWIFDNAVNNICHGSSLGVQGISKLTSDIKENDTVALMTLKDELIAIAKASIDSKNLLKSTKDLAATVHKVFMERNTYNIPSK